ncbi:MULTISPECIES: amidase family protein [Anaeromyxobacter]|uniref:amidase family protein n=1 Tax=Anaeromyxobacter TaxID=161492 RepID=UPI001F572147|nr:MULTISPECIES: amidase family protein [unclassified Anaeromyxobacter]
MAKFRGLSRLDGVGQAALVARGELTASDLLDAFAERLEALNALLRVVPAVDLERARAAKVPPGPFAGVPFLVKEVTPYPGLRWSCGSRVFAGNVAGPETRTPYIGRIDESGLVTVGKSAASEFGLLGSTETLLEGVTHNPWDLSLSAAGSSGGAAAAVAAGIVPLAHANDGGGSIRIPASVCGLFGFKPSRTRCVPASLPSEFGALVSDHCVSRTVRDSALFLSVTEDRAGPLPAVGYVREPLARSLRIATWTRTLLGEEPEPAVRRAVDDAAGLCAALGHRVEPVASPDLDGAALGDAFFIVAGAAVAGLVELVDRLRGHPVQRDELEPFSWALVDELERRGPGALPAARAAFAAGTERYLETIRGYDAVLTPTLATTPWRLGHLSPVLPREELLRRTGRTVGYTPIHNIAGCPAMSVPLHWTEEGIPIGVHFAAAPGADALLLGLAYQLEEARPWAERWAPFSYPRLFEA